MYIYNIVEEYLVLTPSFKYRVTHKGSDFNDDCSEFIQSILWIKTGH